MKRYPVVLVMLLLLLSGFLYLFTAEPVQVDMIDAERDEKLSSVDVVVSGSLLENKQLTPLNAAADLHKGDNFSIDVESPLGDRSVNFKILDLKKKANFTHYRGIDAEGGVILITASRDLVSASYASNDGVFEYVGDSFLGVLRPASLQNLRSDIRGKKSPEAAEKLGPLSWQRVRLNVD